MDKKNINVSDTRLLLNAEPFGFGPTAAIAAVFPYLHKNFLHIAYVGKEHTLDLQKGLPYEGVFDISNTQDDFLQEIFKKYDVFVTAMDFDMARLAKASGLKVIVYDALAWYWEKFPEIIKESDLYIAQDFFNVRERIQFLPNARIVPPIVSEMRERGPKHILINLGGLLNPSWRVEDAATYARLMIKAIRATISDTQIIISTSESISALLNDSAARSFSREEMVNILAQTKCAFMTPGLGNIYDSAQYGIPTVWLPPANTSQGQQVILLKKNGMTDACIDWSDIFGFGVEYGENKQSGFLAIINKYIQEISGNASLEQKLSKIVSGAFEKIENKSVGASRELLKKFGTGGAEKIANLIYNYLIDEHIF